MLPSKQVPKTAMRKFCPPSLQPKSLTLKNSQLRSFGRRAFGSLIERGEVRRSMMEVEPMSDMEAAARAALMEEDEPVDSRNSTVQIVNQIAKNIVTASSKETKKSEAAALPPSMLYEVIRVAPKVAMQENVSGSVGTINVKELRRRSIAAVIHFDVSRKEDYLSEEQFFEVFKMTKTEFDKLPKWKKEMKKKEYGLF